MPKAGGNVAGMMDDALRQSLFSLLADKGAKQIGGSRPFRHCGRGHENRRFGAVPVPKEIVRDLQTAPTKAYYDAYHALNEQLDNIVLAEPPSCKNG